MNTLYNSIPITKVANTIAEWMGIPGPRYADSAIEVLAAKARARFSGNPATRALIYNPDAIALWLYQKYTGMFAEAIVHSDVQLPLLSVMPSVTPVCFASMYTGAMPEVHGIQAYVKPVLKTDTLFDALLRSGKKVAIVSTAGDSVSVIFLERQLEYFIYDTHEACNAKAMELMERDEHDVIVLYNPNYDSTMHRYGPEAPESLAALKDNVETYGALVRKAEACWKGHRSIVGFCTDHGCHEIDGKLGSHGLDMPEDMNVIHLYRFIG